MKGISKGTNFYSQDKFPYLSGNYEKKQTRRTKIKIKSCPVR